MPIVAGLAGSAANAPYYDGDNAAAGAGLPTLGDTLFDPAWEVVGWQSAGGLDAQGDDDLVRLCMALATGSFGPTLGAIVAGALSGVGVHRAAVFDITSALDPLNGKTYPVAYTGVSVADASWASGYASFFTRYIGPLPVGFAYGTWESLVAQVIADTWQGVGGQVLVTGVNNHRIRVDATINLRSADDLNDTSAIDVALFQAATSYFDDRPDWYTWTTKGLRARLSRAHPKILSCSDVTVRDLTTNDALPEPSHLPTATTAGLETTHFALVQNGLTAAYQAAS